MKISIIHLSDLHIKDDGKSSLYKLIESIANFIKGNTQASDEIIIIITGDIAYSGIKTEYNQAQAIFGKLRNFLNNDKIKIIALPGNHDCDFTKNTTVRDIIKKSVIENGRIDADITNQCIAVQDNFNEWVKSDRNIETTDEQTTELFWVHTIQLQTGEKIGICLINSAWISSLHEVAGSLFFPIEKIQYPKDLDFTITALHHPLGWFEPNVARKLREIIEENSDIVLSGHEHISGAESKHNLYTDISCTIINGGCLSGHANEVSSFNLIMYNNHNLEISKVEFEKNSNIYQAVEVAQNVISLKTKFKLSNKFKINQKFRADLDDIGVAFQHPRKEKLHLEDVFVYQDLEESVRTGSAGKTNNQILKSDLVFNGIKESNRTIITGGKNYGKSALCKKLYLDFREHQIIPLYINGTDIFPRHLDNSNFLKLISNIFTSQYEKSNFEEYKQVLIGEKALLIDDFHFAKLNYKGKEDLLALAEKYFGKIIVIADDQFKYDEIFALKAEASLLMSYKNFQIRHLGKRLKDKIIHKWVLLGMESELSLSERIRQQENLLNAIERILDNKAIPALPIYILTLLQTIESAVPTNAISGSHGYMYRFLIEQELLKILKNTVNMDALNKFLSHLAHEIYIENKGSISEDKLDLFITKYKSDHASSVDFKKIVSRLIDGNILSIIGSEIRINRSYYLYFFVGKYFADLLNDGSDYAKKTLKQMIENLYVEDNANIITCTAYHTKNPLLRDSIVEIAKKIFEKTEKFDFSDDVQFLKKLQCTIPSFLLEYENNGENNDREKRLEAEDDHSVEADESSNNSIDQSKEIEDTSVNFNFAMKTIGVLGQLLRAYAGQIDAKDQKQLAEVCFELSMRSINFLVKYLSDNAQDIASVLMEAFKNKSNIQEQHVRNLLYFITQNITVSIMERTANSIGAQDLKDVFKLILERDGSLSTAFLEFVIRLHYSPNTPIKEMKDLKSSIANNRFAADSLRILMVKFMRIHPLSIQERQQIASALELPSSAINKPLLPTNRN